MAQLRLSFATAVWSYVFSGLLPFGLLIGAGSTLARAQSKVDGGLKASPNFSATSRPIQSLMPKAPVQAELPPPPPMRYVPGLEEPLVATSPTTPQEDGDLDATIAAYVAAPAVAGPSGDFADYAKPLLAFISTHPQSNWNAALYLNLGLGYYHAAYYSRTIPAFKNAWKLGRDATTPQAKVMVDRAVGELAEMHARLGHASDLGRL